MNELQQKYDEPVQYAEDAKAFATAFLSWYQRDGHHFDAYMRAQGLENKKLQAFGSRDLGRQALAGLATDGESSELYSNGTIPFQEKVALLQSRYRISDEQGVHAPSMEAVRDYIVMHEWSHNWQRLAGYDSEDMAELDNEKQVLAYATLMEEHYATNPVQARHYGEIKQLAQQRIDELQKGTAKYETLENRITPYTACSDYRVPSTKGLERVCT